MQKRISDNTGASLVEMLAVVLIVSLIALSVGGGIPAIRTAYYKIVRKANAEMLASTTVTLMRDEMAFADPEEVAFSGDNPVFKGQNNVRISFENGGAEDSEAGIQLVRYSVLSEITDEEDRPDGAERGPVVAESYGLYTKLKDGYSFSNGVFTISGIDVYEKTDPSGEKAVFSIPAFSVRCINGN